MPENHIQEKSPLRILFVEDSPHDLSAFRRAFSKCVPPATISHFDCAEKTLEILPQDEALFDIIVTDFNLPGINGLEFCQTLLADKINLPLVILAGTGSESIAVEALKSGVSDYMIKDFLGGYLRLLPTVLDEVIKKYADHVARIKAENALRDAHDQLEIKVAERTIKLQDRTEIIQLLHDIMDKSNNAGSVEEMVQTCLDKICAYLRWPVGHFYRRDFEDSLVSGKIWHIERPEYFARLKTTTEQMVFVCGMGLPGRVMESKQPVWINELIGDGNSPRMGMAGKLGIVSGFAFPIIIDDDVVGVLEFFSDETCEANEEFLKNMGYIGSQIGRVYERKRAAKELGKLSQTIDQSPSLVVITNTDGVIEYVNPKFLQTTGYSITEVIGQNPRIIKSEDTPADVYQDLWQTIKAGNIWRGEIKDRCKDGSFFWASVSISPIRDEDGNITQYVAVHEDITIRKKAEAAIKSASEQAEIANRSKTEMLANMSHELRTPLNAIIGFSGVIIDEIFGPLANGKYMEYAHDISHSGKHLLELINDILDVSAIEAGKLTLYEEKLDIAEVLNASMRLVDHRIKEGGARLSRNFDKNLPKLFADKRRIKQIALNLLSNSGKFTKKGGNISVSLSMDDDGSLMMIFADDGIGMDEKEIAVAISKFGQVDSSLARKYEGTGLGLPLTMNLVEAHDATFSITSEKGVGTTVTIKFPKERIVV